MSPIEADDFLHTMSLVSCHKVGRFTWFPIKMLDCCFSPIKYNWESTDSYSILSSQLHQQLNKLKDAALFAHL